MRRTAPTLARTPHHAASRSGQDLTLATCAHFEVDRHDQEGANEHRQLFGPALPRFGEKTLYADPPITLENSPKLARMVILVFPITKSPRSQHTSRECAPILKLRLDGATTQMGIAGEGPICGERLG